MIDRNTNTGLVPVLLIAAWIMLAAIPSFPTQIHAAKVLDLNENLPGLIEQHPDKNWLIKFYAPWCHYCQQLEPTYNNVAEKVYHSHENLIVGRVDCTKAGHVCERFGVSSYPTIIFINKESQINYKGDRNQDSILAFAHRLQGPTVNIVRDCQAVRDVTNKHGLVILSTITNPDNKLRKQFESLAVLYKASHWFYQCDVSCDHLFPQEGLYLLKRHLNEPIKFGDSIEGVNDLAGGELRRAIVDWLNNESFAIYGKVSFSNIERMLATKKLLVISILNEYKPARLFSATSREFYRRFENLARDYANTNADVLFGWTSDLELIGHITIFPVDVLPNVILSKSDLSFHLVLSNSSDVKGDDKNVDKIDDEFLNRLDVQHIRSLIDDAKADKLIFSGGSSYATVVLRYIMGNINKFTNMYKANPLLVAVLFGFPSIIVMLVIYTTCFYEAKDIDDEDEGYSDDEYDDEGDNRRLLNTGHMKQD